MIKILERAKYNHRNIQYASSKVPLQLWLKGQVRRSTIRPQIYLWIEAKELSTDTNNVNNRPREYTLDDTGIGTGKIRPQEYSIHLLKGPTQNMAGGSAQTVNNLLAGVCIDIGKGEKHPFQKCK